MLKLMRDNFQQLKWALLAVVAAFSIGFVYVDMGLGGAPQAKERDTRSYAARVNGETVSLREYERALQHREVLRADVQAVADAGDGAVDGAAQAGARLARRSEA